MSSIGNGDSTSFWRRSIEMLALVVAGEAVFFLPFILPRVFRATLLDVLDITNLQLGLAFSAYGIVAMIAYLFSGPVADLFSARKLMSISLLATAVGGIAMLALPNESQLRWIYAFWGASTILLFWSALIRATRIWSADRIPATAFGLLDGGRGLASALLGSSSVFLFGALMPANIVEASLPERANAMQQVVWLFIIVTAAAAVFTWFAVPDENSSATRRDDESRFRLSDMTIVLRMPAVWLQAIVVICAYVAYKGLDDVSLYATEVMGMNEVDAARMGAFSMWMRPFAALAAGLIADRVRVIPSIVVSFIVLGLGSAAIASGNITAGMTTLFLIVILGTSCAVFAFRGLYFAVMGETGIPMRVTGTAVGIVSTIGYLPDVFMGPLMGWLLDESPGIDGHADVFAVITKFAVAGLIASIGLLAFQKRPPAATIAIH